MVLAALKKAGREDLIGWEKECLIPPYERKPKTKDDQAGFGGKNTGKSSDGRKPAGKGAGKPSDGRKAAARGAGGRAEKQTERRERGPKHPTKGTSRTKPAEPRRKSR